VDAGPGVALDGVSPTRPARRGADRGGGQALPGGAAPVRADARSGRRELTLPGRRLVRARLARVPRSTSTST
jgi:hypothetical protein